MSFDAISTNTVNCPPGMLGSPAKLVLTTAALIALEAAKANKATKTRAAVLLLFIGEYTPLGYMEFRFPWNAMLLLQCRCKITVVSFCLSITNLFTMVYDAATGAS